MNWRQANAAKGFFFGGLLFVAACSGDKAAQSEITSSAQETSSTTAAPPAETTTTAVETSEQEPPDPGRPSLVLSEDDTDGTWLGRGAMTDESIELFWAGPDGTTGFEIYRVDRKPGDEPENLDMTDAKLVYMGDETAYVDERVRTGARYWYVLQVELPDGATAGRWAEADAVTDTELPDPVTNLTASRSGEEVTLKWSQADDNYLFARYAVRRSVDGEQSVYYGTGFTIDQTSFIDDQLPASGVVTYQVITIDFHDNQADAAVVSIDLG